MIPARWLYVTVCNTVGLNPGASLAGIPFKGFWEAFWCAKRSTNTVLWENCWQHELKCPNFPSISSFLQPLKQKNSRSFTELLFFFFSICGWSAGQWSFNADFGDRFTVILCLWSVSHCCCWWSGEDEMNRTICGIKGRSKQMVECLKV